MKKLIAFLLTAFTFVCVSGTGAKADGTAILGFLVCQKTGPGTTYLLFSSRPVSCTCACTMVPAL